MGAVLQFDETLHQYRVGDRELISVTQALTEAGLIDATWFTEEAALRGTYVHAAIAMHHEGDLDEDDLDPALRPYLGAYVRFLAESGFRVDAAEERVFSEALGCAGTLDIRGAFPSTPRTGVDIIDIKTGTVPAWVGYQTAAYARMLPTNVPALRLRWALNLQSDGSYRLQRCGAITDWHVFSAALTIAQVKRGWL